MVEALRADAAHLGVETVTDTISSLTRSGGRVTGVQGRAWHPADHGACRRRLDRADRESALAGVGRAGLGTDGEGYPWPGAARASIVFGHGGYVLHRNGEAWAGSTVEHAGFLSEVTEAGVAEIRSGPKPCFPLAGTPIRRAWAGLRPGTPDGLPIVGREPDLEGVWYATGHGRNGCSWQESPGS